MSITVNLRYTGKEGSTIKFAEETAGIVLTVGCLGGIPFLIITYNRIYRKYKK